MGGSLWATSRGLDRGLRTIRIGPDVGHLLQVLGGPFALVLIGTMVLAYLDGSSVLVAAAVCLALMAPIGAFAALAFRRRLEVTVSELKVVGWLRTTRVPRGWVAAIAAPLEQPIGDLFSDPPKPVFITADGRRLPIHPAWGRWQRHGPTKVNLIMVRELAEILGVPLIPLESPSGPPRYVR